MSGQVRLSDAAKDTLERIKEKHDHTSIDSAFREIAMKAGVEVVPDKEFESEGSGDGNGEDNDGDDDVGWSSGWEEEF